MSVDESFPKSERLTKKSEFEEIYGRGTRYSHRFFTLFVMDNVEGPRKIGFTVGKRVGIAVVRNRVKRLMRETYRRNRSRFRADIRVVVVGRPGCGELRGEEFSKELAELFRTGGMTVG